MRQCAGDQNGEVGAEGGAEVLGMFGVSEVQDDAESLRVRTGPPLKLTLSHEYIPLFLIALITLRVAIPRSK